MCIRDRITGITTISASGYNVTLDTATNNFANEVRITGAVVTVVDENAINLGASTVTGTYHVTATAGDITNTGALIITGASTFIVGTTTSNIVLDHASNAFSNSVTMKAGTSGNLAFGNIEFVDSAAVVIQTSADTNADGELLIDGSTDGVVAVSYTHLTLPTKRIV